MNQGECYDLRQVEDEDEFVETKSALKVRTHDLSFFDKADGTYMYLYLKLLSLSEDFRWFLSAFSLLKISHQSHEHGRLVCVRESAASS